MQRLRLGHRLSIHRLYCGSSDHVERRHQIQGVRAVEFVKSEVISLKANPMYNEKWLQDRIAEDPGLLGLGDLILKDSERRQPRAGRLDLLLVDAEGSTRYEVEIQLGSTDEAHIIRTIEYWDIEKSRFPQYEHVAVLVAEDITSRFLNVISLLNKSIPLIAIQMQALRVDQLMTLSATTVLDLMTLGTEEEDEPEPTTDRSYWITRGSPESVAICDQVLGIVSEVVNGGINLNYRKRYIGLARGSVPDNFVTFFPKKQHVLATFRVPRSEDLDARLQEAELDTMEYQQRRGRYRVFLRADDIAPNRSLLTEMVQRASGTPAGEE
jgi:hypothetical protein